MRIIVTPSANNATTRVRCFPVFLSSFIKFVLPSWIRFFYYTTKPPKMLPRICIVHQSRKKSNLLLTFLPLRCKMGTRKGFNALNQKISRRPPMKRTHICKLIALALAVAMLFTFAGCAEKKEDNKFTIGICQLAPHEALDAATKGFKDAIIEALGEENVTFLEQNAAGENNVCTTIVNDFVSKDVDLIMANATAALQAAANATLDIPILGTSITEYGVALELENFKGTVGGNISGTSDLAPLDEQAQMILDLVPTAKTVGILYCSAEPNSAYQVKVVSEYLQGKGIAVKEGGYEILSPEIPELCPELFF